MAPSAHTCKHLKIKDAGNRQIREQAFAHMTNSEFS